MGMENESNVRREGIDNYEVSHAGIELIKKFEGRRLEPYICPGGALTVGYGQCIPSQDKFDALYPHGFSEKDAEDLLRSSLTLTYVPDVKRLVTVPLSQREFDMLVSLDYNIGATALRDPSSKAQNDWTQINILTPLNNRDYAKASLELPKFTKGGPDKPYYRGLLKRRMSEMFVFRNSTSIPEALRTPIEDDNFRKVTKCDSIAKYWEESGQQPLREEAVLLYKAYNDQTESTKTIR